MTTSFTVPYLLLLEPEPADVIFASKDAFALWNNPFKSSDDSPVKSFDNIPSITREINVINSEDVDVRSSVNVDKRSAKLATITISGSSTAVLDTRSRILRKYYEIGIDHVGVDTLQLLDQDGQVKQSAADKLQAIATYTSTSIFITKVLDSSLRPSNPTPMEADDMWKPYHILTYGDLDSIAFAKTRIGLLIDDLNGNFIDRMAVPLSLHPLLAGRENSNFSKVALDSRTKIYTPALFPSIHGSMDENHARRNYDELFISGDNAADIDKAKSLIEDLIQRIPVFCKDFVVPFAKIDYILLNHLNVLEDLSRQNGAFIQFPSLGAARSLIRIQCPSHIFVEKTIRAVARLVCDVYSVGYWIHEGQTDDDGYLLQPTEVPALDTLRDAISRIAASTGADISFLKCTFDITGPSEAAKNAVSQVRGLPFWASADHQVRFRIELSVDQREFIAGKKNGKINRIMSNAHVWIKFEPFTEYNFFVDLVAPSYTSALFGAQLLEDELPAELSFYIPEPFHRSIIGVGGQQIQSLMRKYNVFVKFSNAFEQVSDVGTMSRTDNVVVRCPSKNKENLAPVKKDIEDMVVQLEKQGSSQSHGHHQPHHHHSSTQPYYNQRRS
ncbi:hypothetical protein V1514DRAFT_348400 [Lipomyces japonicus]|uniref:uncharacterized protein n=1 Tax=Lipomyces japonicus TaxID=56871 RepID=UPI0034CEB2DC